MILFFCQNSFFIYGKLAKAFSPKTHHAYLFSTKKNRKENIAEFSLGHPP